jgi:hypothetical protein
MARGCRSHFAIEVARRRNTIAPDWIQSFDGMKKIATDRRVCRDFWYRFAGTSSVAVGTSAVFRFSFCLRPFAVPSAAVAVLLLPPGSVDAVAVVVALVWAELARSAPPAADSPAEDFSLAVAAQGALLVSHLRRAALGLPASIPALELGEADCSGVQPAVGLGPVEDEPRVVCLPEQVVAEDSIDPPELAVAAQGAPLVFRLRRAAPALPASLLALELGEADCSGVQPAAGLRRVDCSQACCPQADCSLAAYCC